MIRFLSVLVVLLAGCTPHHFIVKQPSGLTVSLTLPEAREVLFASSVDSFRLHPLQKEDDEIWVVSNLADEEFRYFYLVDGQLYIPECELTENDDFGTANCIYQPE